MTQRSADRVAAGSCLVLDEPVLSFGHNQHAVDPRDGLALFGPYSLDQPGHPHTPAYGLIATSAGSDLFSRWVDRLNAPAFDSDRKRHRLWPPYPGFGVAFGSKWATTPAFQHTLSQDSLRTASRRKDSHERAYAVVDQVVTGFERLPKSDSNVSVVVCVIPDEVWLNCRSESRVSDPTDLGLSSKEKRLRTRGQRDMFTPFEREQYQLSPDFRRQLKARIMAYGVPLQIIRESTLRTIDGLAAGERHLTPLSDRLWNIAAALYYKCGGKPWRLEGVRAGTCYVGIAFRRQPNSPRTACCAAQMFLDSGDGVVFLGEYGPWYSPERRQFRLSRDAATRLLAGVIKTYGELHGGELREIFLHSRSEITDDEFAGYRAAMPRGCEIVGVRVRSDRNGPRLLRLGDMPVLRGTFWRTGDRTGYLYAAGFKPRLGTYDGWETPVPLRIDVQHGSAPIERVAGDILGLTKLNYNACRLGESQPVTVRFSDAVGEILISNPTVTDVRPTFKFYI